MKTLCTILAIVLCVSVAMAQTAITPAFKHAALEALDALERVHCLPSIADPPGSLSNVEAKRYLDIAHRKTQSAADKNVYQMLYADLVFQASAAVGSETWESDFENHEQCVYEIKVVLHDKVDEMKLENVAKGRQHLCLKAYAELEKRY